MLLLSASLLLGMLSAQKMHDHTMHHTADEFARVLDDPERDSWQKPHEVVMALALKPGEVVADVGAGTGYFAKRFARHGARVIAVDISQKLLDMAKKHEPKLELVLASENDPKLPAGAVQTIFICNTLHHIGNRAAYYPKLAAALAPGGRIVVVDFHKNRRLPVGPPEEARISREAMVAELKAAGFKLTQEWKSLPTQYFLEFKR